MRAAPPKSEEPTSNKTEKSPETDAPSTIEGENSPKKQTTLSQKGQGQSEGQILNGDTPTGREIRNYMKRCIRKFVARYL